MKAEHPKPEASARESFIQVRESGSVTPTIVPPSLFDSVSEREGLGVGTVTQWAFEQKRLRDSLARARRAISRRDKEALVVVDVLGLLGEGLDDLHAVTEDPRAQGFLVREMPLDDYLKELYDIAERALSRLANPTERPELCMFWALAERVAVLPRLDARPWVERLSLDLSDPAEPLRDLATDTVMVSAAVAALGRALRDLSAAPKRDSFAPEGLEEYLPKPETLFETILPPSRTGLKAPVLPPEAEDEERRAGEG